MSCAICHRDFGVSTGVAAEELRERGPASLGQCPMGPIPRPPAPDSETLGLWDSAESPGGPTGGWSTGGKLRPLLLWCGQCVVRRTRSRLGAA